MYKGLHKNASETWLGDGLKNPLAEVQKLE